MRSKKSLFYLLILTLFLTFNLISCGGGGGGTAATSPLFSENFSSFDDGDSFPPFPSSLWTALAGGAPPLWHIRETVKALNVDSPGYIVYAGSGSESWTDYSLTFKVKLTDVTKMAIVSFRFIGGPENGLSYYQVNIGGGGLSLSKNASDNNVSWVLNSQVIAYSADIYYPMRIDVKGNNIKVYFDDAATPNIDFTDDGSYGALQPAGSIGFGSNDSYGHVFYDDIVVTPI